MKTFAAEYESRCEWCGDMVEPGDEIAGSDDGYMHEECILERTEDDPFSS